MNSGKYVIAWSTDWAGGLMDFNQPQEIKKNRSCSVCRLPMPKFREGAYCDEACKRLGDTNPHYFGPAYQYCPDCRQTYRPVSYISGCVHCFGG